MFELNHDIKFQVKNAPRTWCMLEAIRTILEAPSYMEDLAVNMYSYEYQTLLSDLIKKNESFDLKFLADKSYVSTEHSYLKINPFSDEVPLATMFSYLHCFLGLEPVGTWWNVKTPKEYRIRSKPYVETELLEHETSK